MRRITPLLLAVLALVPGSLTAQFVPLTLPKGRWGLEFRTYSEIWDHRFLDGVRQPAGTDWTRQAIGANVIPALLDAEAILAEATGVSGKVLNLGGFSAEQITTEREFGLGLSLGVTSRLTLSGMIPFRRVRVRTITSFDSTGATAGFNPADPTFGNGGGTTVAFFANFDAALAALSEGLTNGRWDDDPTTRALAEATLTEGQALRDGLHDVFVNPATRSVFLPTAGSLAGTALANRIGTLQQRFSEALDIPGFAGLPALPAEPLTTDGFLDFLTNPDGPVAGSTAAPPYTALGDIELGAAYLFVNRPAASPWGTSVRTAVNATVRLRTSRLDNPDRFFDLGTGDRQPDVELGMSTDLARGRAAVRITGWYNMQLPGNQLRRIGPSDQPLQYAHTRAAVRKNPGDVWGVAVLPGYRFTPRFALVTGAIWWHRGTDTYQYAKGQEPVGEDLDPNLLGVGSAASALTLRGGLTWAHPGDGGAPVDASVTWERVVSATGGRVPQSETVRAILRVYGRIW